ncbi:MAG: dienelactone hydrolase [Halieaceae bacterium]
MWLPAQSVLALVALVVIAACAPQSSLLRKAGQLGLQGRTISTEKFDLLTVWRVDTPRQGLLHVYLGSDGTPWQGRAPAKNPEGRAHLALELMRRDPGPAVYLGRPCYPPSLNLDDCPPARWTSGRYSRATVAALDEALSQLKEQYAARELTLIGYSGGGVLALLLGAGRTDVVRVISVAAPLDVEAWSEHHGVLPLTESINPARQPAPVRPLQHRHLHGAQDEIVPLETTQLFFTQHENSRLIVEEDFGHVCCWVRDWPALLEAALQDQGAFQNSAPGALVSD